MAISLWRVKEELPCEKMIACSFPGCNNREIKQFYKISEVKCSLCGNYGMKYAFKCRKCDYEFACIPSEMTDSINKADEEIRKIRQKEMKCPNCDSIDTYAVPVR